MGGFFGIKNYQKKKTRKKTIPGCGACKLCNKCKSPKMKPVGKFNKKILIIGESPSRNEDRTGKPLSGKGSEILEAVLKKYGVDLHRDCLKTNAIRCYAPTPKKGQRDDSIKYIDHCRPNITQLIAKYKPKLIIPLGKYAIRSVIGDSYSKDIGGVGKWRGFAIPDRNHGCWVCPTFHPSFLIHTEREQYDAAFERDIRNALAGLDKSLPVFADEDESCTVLTDTRQIKKYLRGLLKREVALTAFDYEGTGLKPHVKGHKITCVAIAESADKSVAFPMLKAIQPLFIEYLQNSRMFKMAANMKYEEAWSRVKLGTPVASWFFDTMLAAHCLDNRSGVCSLKFQTYVTFGIGDYDSHIEGFLKSGGKCANDFNTIHLAPMREILKYCAMDSLLEYRLGILQMQRMGIMDPVELARSRRIM